MIHEHVAESQIKIWKQMHLQMVKFEETMTKKLTDAIHQATIQNNEIQSLIGGKKTITELELENWKKGQNETEGMSNFMRSSKSSKGHPVENHQKDFRIINANKSFAKPESLAYSNSGNHMLTGRIKPSCVPCQANDTEQDTRL